MVGKIAKVALAAAFVLTLAGAAPATANPRDVIERGSCSGSSHWKLKLSPEDGRIEVEFEVDSNVSGQTWRVRLFQDGDKIFGGNRVTRGASGSFDVRKVTGDGSGTDPFTARATHEGETCRGSASI
jgi:hypothetical protein